MDKRIKPFAITVLVALLGAYLLANISALHKAHFNDPAFNRVLQTNTLRCGYILHPPSLMKDPHTGEMSGVFFDYVTQMAKDLNLKVVWSEQVTAATYAEALASGRIDAMCSGLVATAARALQVDFITPVYYLPIYAYARQGDKRFDNFSVERFNDPSYKLLVLEGGYTSIVQKQFFPNTKIKEVARMEDYSDLFTGVAQEKADFVLFDSYAFADYNLHNPNKLRRVSRQPISIFPYAMAVAKDEGALREMLDTATVDLQLSGTMEEIIAHHERYSDNLIRMALPYQR